MRLLTLLICLTPFSAFSETLQIKLPSLPLSLTKENPPVEDISEGSVNHYKVSYKVTLSAPSSGATSLLYVGVSAEASLDYTIFEGGRREEPYDKEETPDLRLTQHYNGGTRYAIPYEGKATPYLSLDNCLQDRGVERQPLAILKAGLGNHHVSVGWGWRVRFPKRFTEGQLDDASVQINQGAGLLTLTIPDRWADISLPTLSEYNLQKHFPFCFDEYSLNTDVKVSCLIEAVSDLRSLDVISRQEKLTGQKKTPLQKKVFRKTKEYRALRDEMKSLKSALSSLLFCMPLSTGAYDLRHKGLDVSNTIEDVQYGEPPLSMRFSNLKPRVKRDAHTTEKGSPKRTFLKMSETDGLSLEQKSVVGCFNITKKLSFKKGTYRSFFRSHILRTNFKHKYHFLEANLSQIILEGVIYSVDKKGRLKKQTL